jgi:hypothetical protein
MQHRTLGPLIILVVFAGFGSLLGCATADPPLSSGPTDLEEDYPVCSAPVLGVPNGAFPGFSGAQILSTLREHRLLPTDDFSGVIRFPGEIVEESDFLRFNFNPLSLAFPGALQLGSTRGPMVSDIYSWWADERAATVSQHDGGSRVSGIVHLEVFIDANGKAQATRLRPGSIRVTSSKKGRRAESAAVQLVRRHQFRPAVVRGCRLPSWTVIPVFSRADR